MITKKDLDKWYNEGKEKRDAEMTETRKFIEEEFCSMCCSANVKDGFCCDCGEQTTEVICS